jgi:hypothetical protein
LLQYAYMHGQSQQLYKVQGVLTTGPHAKVHVQCQTTDGDDASIGGALE